MGGKAVAPQVLGFLEKNAGKVVTLDDAVSATKLDPAQIQSAITNMRRNHQTLGEAIEVLSRGQMWRYTATPNGSSRPSVGEPPILGGMFELIGYGEGNALVLRDENGVMYVAQKARLR